MQLMDKGYLSIMTDQFRTDQFQKYICQIKKRDNEFCDVTVYGQKFKAHKVIL